MRLKDPDHYVLTLPIPESINATGRGKRHWAQVAAAAKEWHLLVGAEVNRVGGAPRDPWERALVTLRYFFPCYRRRDPDNAVAGAKAVLDGLVHAGLLVDDTFDNVALAVEKGGVDAGRPRLEVHVRRVTGC